MTSSQDEVWWSCRCGGWTASMTYVWETDVRGLESRTCEVQNSCGTQIIRLVRRWRYPR